MERGKGILRNKLRERRKFSHVKEGGRSCPGALGEKEGRKLSNGGRKEYQESKRGEERTSVKIQNKGKEGERGRETGQTKVIQRKVKDR